CAALLPWQADGALRTRRDIPGGVGRLDGHVGDGREPHGPFRRLAIGALEPVALRHRATVPSTAPGASRGTPASPRPGPRSRTSRRRPRSRAGGPPEAPTRRPRGVPVSPGAAPPEAASRARPPTPAAPRA